MQPSSYITSMGPGDSTDATDFINSIHRLATEIFELWEFEEAHEGMYSTCRKIRLTSLMRSPCNIPGYKQEIQTVTKMSQRCA